MKLADFALAILEANPATLEGALLALHGHRNVSSGFEPDGSLLTEPMDIAFREGRTRPHSMVMSTGSGPVGLTVRGRCLILSAWERCPFSCTHRLVGRLASSGERVTLEGDVERLKGFLGNLARTLNPPPEGADEPTLE